MSSDFLCNVFVTKRTSSFSTHLSSISLVTHSSAFISLLKKKHCTRLVSPSKICHKLHSDYVTEAQLLVHLLWATCLPWVTDLNGYSIQSNWNVMCIIPTGAQIFFWSFLYTVEALQTDSLVSTQLYLWQPSQNLTSLNSRTDSVLLHFHRQPVPVLLWTPFLYPESVHSWRLPLYFIHFISWTMKCRTQTLRKPENKIPWLFTDVVTINTSETHFVFPWFSPWLWQPCNVNGKWRTQTWKVDQHILIPGILCWEIWCGHP